MKNILRFALAGACLFCFVACRMGAAPTATHLTIVGKDASVVFQFGNWILVFEGIHTGPEAIVAEGSISYPDPAGSGSQDASFGDLKLKQSWDAQANSISVNDYTFKLTDAGKRLAFADHTYEAADAPKTIVISKDGSTREQTSSTAIGFTFRITTAGNVALVVLAVAVALALYLVFRRKSN